MADDAELISLEVDPADAVKGTNVGNAAMDGYSRKAQAAVSAASRAFSDHGGVVVRTSDRSRGSLERLVSSVEKLSQSYGKTGVERLIAQRDQLIQRLGNEEAAVKRVTEAYAKMISAETAAANGGNAGGGTSGFRLNYAIRGVKDVFEGRGTFAIAEATNELLALRGLPLIIGGITAGLAGAGFVAYELVKHLEEVRESATKTRDIFSRFNDAGKLANDELKVTNDRLQNAIAKLEHKPENNLKLAIDEAALAADRLAEKMDKSLRGFAELVKTNAPGAFSQILFHQAGMSDIQEMIQGKTGFGGMVGELYQAGGNPLDVLGRYRGQVSGLLERADIENRIQQGKATPAEERAAIAKYGTINVTQNQAQRIEVLQALLRQIDELSQAYNLEKSNATLSRRKDLLEGAKEAPFGEIGGKFITFQEFLQKFSETLNKQVELQQRASEKMFSGAITLSHAGQYNPNVPASESEALNALDVSNVTRFLLPSAMLPHRRAEMTTGNELADWWKNYQEDQRKEDQRHLSALEKQEQIETQIAKIHTSGDERSAIERVYQMRLDYAQRIYDLESKTAGETAARDKFDERTQDARIQRATELAQLEQKRFDAIAKQSSALYETLFTNPHQFGRQLGGTIRNAALRPVTEGLGNLTASFLYPLFYGGRGGGINDVQLIDGAVPVHVVGMGGRSSGGGSSAPFVGGGFSPVSGGWDGAAAVPFVGAGMSPIISMIGSGGPGPSISGRSSGLAGLFRRGGAGGLLTRGGFLNGWLANVKDNFWNEDINLAPGVTQAASSMGFGGKLAGVLTSKGAGSLELAAGLPLAMAGIGGTNRGTGTGIVETMFGGALTGAGIGTMILPGIGTAIGAGVGAVVGAGIGTGEKIAGVESPQHEAQRLIQQIYGISLQERSGVIQQIVGMAQQYGGSISMAVRTPQVRQLIELYAMSTGQKSNAFLDTPHAASLIQQNGTLYQGLSYFNGSGYSYASPLPTLGYSSGTIPTANPYAGGASGPPIQVNLNPQQTVDLWRTGTSMAIQGSPRAVAASANAGNVADASRLSAAATLLSPSSLWM